MSGAAARFGRLGGTVRRAVSGRFRRVRGPLVPPRKLLAHTSSPTAADFAAGGQVALRCCTLGGLRPTDRVLDIGCGVGRVAVPLTGFLAPEGAYVGVDLWRAGVEWCRAAISSRFPNFSFRHVDAVHPRLNPRGTVAVDALRLPVPAGSFDFVVLGAINHLDAATLQALVGEAGRALRPGGTYVGTWYLTDVAGRDRLPRGAEAVACGDAEMRSVLRAAGLDVIAIHRGSWRGAAGAPAGQDLVVGRRLTGA